MKRREVRERDEAAERERLEARTEGLLAQLRANEVARAAPPPPSATKKKPAAKKPAAEEPPVSGEGESANAAADEAAGEPAVEQAPDEGEPS